MCINCIFGPSKKLDPVIYIVFRFEIKTYFLHLFQLVCIQIVFIVQSFQRLHNVAVMEPEKKVLDRKITQHFILSALAYGYLFCQFMTA